MTIKDTRKNAVPFRTLKRGTVFTFNDVFYMVIDKVKLDDLNINTVRLSDGGVSKFRDETMVFKVDAELRI
jgi:hypothetical protein